jgi:hypothetical protein
MVDFYMAIREIADSLQYGQQVQDNVRQASVIRIGDLLENAGHVVNVQRSMPLQLILNHPTIMEIGRVGSVQDTALLMGFLLVRFAEEVERNPRPANHPHITVIEEAHRLMAEVSSSLGDDSRSAAGEDFSNILAEVRGHGEGIIIAEQIPTLLVKGAIGNTYFKLMHWLEDVPSFDLFGNIMNLNVQQREYARTLGPGFAIARSQYGRPVHIKVPEFGDQEGFVKVRAEDISDQKINEYMRRQREHLGIEDVPVIQWQASLSAEQNGSQPWGTAQDALKLMVRAPMQTCVFCKPLHESQKCLYAKELRESFLNNESNRENLSALFSSLTGEEDTAQRKIKFEELLQDLNQRLGSRSEEERQGLIYCYLAHKVNELAQTRTPGDQDALLRLRKARGVLQQVGLDHAGSEE